MEQGNLMSETAQVDTLKEQHAPEENRHIALFNTNKEFNRAINEENVQNLIQKIENHPQRQALQSDLQ